jgi:hypothetical protein
MYEVNGAEVGDILGAILFVDKSYVWLVEPMKIVGV